MSEQQQTVRNIQLLEGEEMWLALHSRDGLLEEVPLQGDFVVLTNQRLIGFWQEEGRHRWVLLPIQNVEAVEVSDLAKSTKPLVQGGLLLLGAVAVFWLAAAFNLGFLSWLIVGILVLLASITASTYFVAEETAMITLRARTGEIVLPLHTSEALRDAYSLATGFFQAKAGQVPTDAREMRYQQVPSAETPTSWQRTSEPGQDEDTAAPVAASHPTDSPQAEFPMQPANVPMPSSALQSSESAQAEGGEDI